MKGTITKLDNQWMVRYDTFQNDHSYPLPAYNFLPLHPEYQTILPLDLDLEGNEVEFDWCVIVDHDTGKGKEYAKLLDKKEKISDRRSYIAKRLVKEMPRHIADMVDTYAEKIAYLEKFIIDEILKENDSWEGCDGCTEQDEIMYKNGYAKGYNAAIAELPKEIPDDRTKLHWKTSLVVHTPEISDRELALFLRWLLKHYSTTTIDGMFGYVDSLGREMDIETIIDHYTSEQ